MIETNSNPNNKFVLKLDSSQLSQYLICSLSWYLKYKENLRFNTKRAPAPDRGILIHKLLEHFYLNIAKGESRSRAANLAIIAFKDENWPKEYGLEHESAFLKERFMQYVAHYSEEDNDLINIKTSTGTAGIEIGFSKILFEDESKIFIVEGRIDFITELNQALAWVDHKTQGRVGDLYPYHPQFLTYAWATGLDWGMINYIAMHEKYDPKKTFRRNLTMYPRYMIDAWETKMLLIFNEIYNLNLDPILFEARVYAKRNPQSCAGPYGSNPCQFTHLCEIDFNATALRETIKNSAYLKVEPWSPWKEKLAEEQNGE